LAVVRDRQAQTAVDGGDRTALVSLPDKDYQKRALSAIATR
jgi:hypothetical protein